MQDQFSHISNQLEGFIQKYHLNKLLKGVLITLVIALLLYLLAVNFAYFVYLESSYRTALFFFLITSLLLVGIFYVIDPILKLTKISKSISYEQASQIIGRHFSEVDDKLKNTLELYAKSKNSELARAAINQKAEEFSSVNFSSAINLKTNKKYVYGLLLLLFILLGVFIVNPLILKKGTQKIVQYDKHFQREFPFAIQFISKNLQAQQNQDFTLKILTQGKILPQELFIQIGSVSKKMQVRSDSLFSYEFTNLQKDFSFAFSDGKYVISSHDFKVYNKPILKHFTLDVEYPHNTRKRRASFENKTNITVPSASKLTFNMYTKHTSDVHFLMDSNLYEANKVDDQYVFSKQVFNTQQYHIVTSNDSTGLTDTMLFTVQSIDDAFPQITVKEFKDSIYSKKLYFSGFYSDDYGFKELVFHYQVSSNGEGSTQKFKESIKINTQKTKDAFTHYFDFSNLQVKSSDVLTYFFEIRDNDYVNNYKSTFSNKFSHQILSTNELNEQVNNDNKEIKDALSKSTESAQKLQQEIDALYKDILEQKKGSWQNQDKLNNILDKHQQLEQKLEQLSELNQEKINKQNALEVDPELLDKQQQIQDLMQKLLSEEMKEIMQQMQEMLDKLKDNKKIDQDIDQMKLDNEEVKKELDRTLELFKQIEFEQKLQSNIDKLNELKEKQEQLSKQNDASDAQKQAQDQLNKEMQELAKEMKETQELNEQLEYKNDLPDNLDNQSQSIENEQQKASENMNQNNSKKASENQKNAADQMQEMAQQMQQAMNEMQQEAQQENLDDMRQLLENLITLSFDQEALMKKIKTVGTKDPSYNSLVQWQHKLQDDAKHIEDSLFALSKRVPEISSTVNKEINELENNLGQITKLLANRKKAQAVSKQQSAMTNANNLALLFDEIIQQMQQQMMAQKQSSGSCNKPGQGKGQKPSASSMRKMQQQLNKQIQQLKEELAKDGKQSKGGKQNQNGQSMSEKLMKMAAQQEQVRKMLRDAQNQLGESGSGASKKMKEMQKLMEQTETDIVNKKITQQTINRQQDILTRLLESEKAEREREQDQKRTSSDAKNEYERNKNEFFKYKTKEKENITEMLKYESVKLNSFYNEKVNRYLNNLE